jgi:glucose/arabinose dehydrogenase
MRVRRSITLLAALLLLFPTAPARAAVYDPNGFTLSLVRVASGLSQPLYVTHAGDGTNRLFIVEKTGRIKVLKNGQVLSTPFLNLSASVSQGGEQGVLGLAFHPNYETNRLFYVNFTNLNGDTVINEYHANATNPDRADGRPRQILFLDQPYSNHNGGALNFGKDGYLYIATGDGGGAGDPGNRAQSLGSLFGKMLRIDVNGVSATKPYRIPSSNPYVGKSGLDEIFARGLRNPWRFSFDKVTGDMWTADVGQNSWEEVNRTIYAQGNGNGINYGWRVMEGRHCYSPPTGCNTSGKFLPLVEYGQTSTRCSVTGGYVYRGYQYTVMRGGYFFGDYCSGEIWTINSGATFPASPVRKLDTKYNISSFGQGEYGQVYITALNTGEVFRLVGTPN